jgi:preprotein translocase subunit SecA
MSIYCPGKGYTQEGLAEALHALATATSLTFDAVTFDHRRVAVEDAIIDYILYHYEQIRGRMSKDMLEQAEKWILLETIDHAWRLHLQNIDHLREGIGLRGYGQKNPLIEYKKESFYEFERMMEQIKWDIMQHLFKMRPDEYDASAIEEIEREKEKELASLQLGGDVSPSAEGGAKTVRREAPKVGRNEPCPCGSGKKYKQCCGKN